MSQNNPAAQRVLKLVQELLVGDTDPSTITPAFISTQIDKVLGLNPSWGNGLDRNYVIDELIRRFSLWIGKETALTSEVGHVAWLVSERKHEWRYWHRYQEWLDAKLAWTAIDALDQSTDAVLGLLEDPKRTGVWDRRGLVVGHVQSGKTGHYTGLICKAADAGYKVIIVLAGLHNNLRAQTQVRLDEGFLGYATMPNPSPLNFVGAGANGRDANIKPNCATNRTQNGDFNTKVAQHLAITPEQRPWLFVVKKNKTVLQRLLSWIRNHAADHTDASGRRLITQLPLLVIDDEADHASVDTGELVFDANGAPDDNHQPTAINSLIRKILHSATRSAYVGYTATPFANIFIHEAGETKEEGPDLFPSAFIVSLAASSNYIGPGRVFGLSGKDGLRRGLPLIRTISDYACQDGVDGWMPVKHKNGHTPLLAGQRVLPDSLKGAIHAFILACAARSLRGQSTEHCSMLVHVTRFNSVQNEVYGQIQEYLRNLNQRLQRNIGVAGDYETFRSLWERDFLPTTAEVRRAIPEECGKGDAEWAQLAALLPDMIADITVRMINGTAKDALDYEDHREIGLKVIAVGGDKLARGLTLEGLCVSYFLRASKMYDTLMQMGRWFGYRPQYLDLCRLYTTDELVEWFGHITDASEELREEFDLMVASGSTPRDYGLKVQSHPVLMVTSRLKMRSAKNLWLSFSGQLVETIAFHRNRRILDTNLKAVKHLIAQFHSPEINPVRKRGETAAKWKGFLWESVPASCVIDFLRQYQTHPDAYKVNSAMLADFIASMATSGELITWTVALVGGGAGASFELAPGVAVDMLERSSNSKTEDRYSIGRLLSSRDEALDFDDPAWQAALQMTKSAWHADPARQHNRAEPDEPNGPAIRNIRGFGAQGVPARPERGLLLLYALDPAKANADLPAETPPVIGFGISFPGSNTGTKVEYKVTNLLWSQEYGPAE